MRKIDFMPSKPISTAMIGAWLAFGAGASFAQTAVPPSSSAPARSVAVANSVSTVDELLKIENAKVLAAARMEAIISGAIKPGTAAKTLAKPPPPPPPLVKVDAIYGLKDSLRADIHIDAHRYSNLRGGSIAGSCEVVEVFDRCVTLRPDNKKVPQSQCPSACWSGVATAEPSADYSSPSGQILGQNSIMPAPIPQMSITSPAPQVRVPVPGILPEGTPRGASTSFIAR